MGWYLGTRSNEEIVRPVVNAPLPSTAPPLVALPLPGPLPAVTSVAPVQPSVAMSIVEPAPTPPKESLKAARVRGRNCNPPYTVDADGIRIPKPECL